MNGNSNDGRAVSIRQKLLNLARTRAEDYNLVLTRYALERFLYRLSCSPHRQELILKGALLFQIWSEAPHRATRDLDLLAGGDVSMEGISAKVTAICRTPVPDDGLIFDMNDLIVNEIREESQYGGFRAKFSAKLSSAKIPIQIDIAAGDAVTPSAPEMQYPTLLAMPAPYIYVYPQETVIAEKLEAIVVFGLDNTRTKDYFDLWYFASAKNYDMTLLPLAVRRTFDRRGQAVPSYIPPGLSDLFANNRTKQAQWNGFVARVSGKHIPLEEVVSAVRSFAMPLFSDAAAICLSD